MIKMLRVALMTVLLGLSMAGSSAVACNCFVPESATEGRALVLCLVVGTIPAVIVGLLLEDWIDSRMSTPAMASAMLLVTGGVLLLSRREGAAKSGWTRSALTPRIAILIGLAQAMALPPGISRSGMTIVAALLLGIDRREAVRFSFLLSIPTIGGALVLMLARDGIPAQMDGAGLLLSGVAAFAAGYGAIWAVARITKAGRLYRFSAYCFAVGILGLVLSL